MSDASGGEGWWQASDGKWYPPDQHPEAQAGATQAMGAAEPPPTAAMPTVPPPAPPGPLPPPGPGAPPPGAPGGGSSNAKWIIVGALAVAAIAIAAFLLTRGDDKKNNVAATSSSSSPSSSSSSSSSSSKSSSSSSKSSSSSSKSSSSSSGPSAAQVQSRLLKASDVSPEFSDETFTPDDTSPTPCGQPNTAKQFPPVVDVGSQMSNTTGDLFFQQEVTIYKDASTGQQAFNAGKASVSCTQGTVGSSSETVTFTPPKDVSSDFGVPEAVEIDFVSGDIQGQLFAIHSGDTIATFQFAGSSSADTSAIPSPEDIVKKGLTKLSS